MEKRVNLTLDSDFYPISLFFKAYKESTLKSHAYQNLSIIIERNDGFNACYHTVVSTLEEKTLETNRYVERLVKSLLWIYGGWKIIIIGSDKIYQFIKEIYQKERLFDAKFMERIYEKKFVVEYQDTLPMIKEESQSIGKHTKGYRIGFDAGGSDLKVSGVVEGEAIFSEEIIWYPKLNSDPNYHLNLIKETIMSAAKKLPKVDAIGVSSAGVFINNQVKVASLFIKVPDDLFNAYIKNIYIDLAEELNVPIEVANDGDVTALAGSMSLGKNKLLGIALGTSEAAGYINASGYITGWLNELAFVPLDVQKDGGYDEWSMDLGVGSQYFSQDAIIRLAKKAGLQFTDEMPLAERLKVVQKLDPNSEVYQEIYKTMGYYVGFGLAFYHEFYDFEEVLLLGRVMSGEGGKIIVEYANQVIKEYFQEISKKIHISLPDEKSRRVGQSVAAASLVKL